MSDCFLDASAVGKRYADEPGSTWIRQITEVQAQNAILLSEITLAEVAAALDARNPRRFPEMLEEFSKKTQFIIVTHNRSIMESADILYGVTLAEDGTSKILSLKLE